MDLLDDVLSIATLVHVYSKIPLVVKVVG
jgi:hypothetical protein